VRSRLWFRFLRMICIALFDASTNPRRLVVAKLCHQPAIRPCKGHINAIAIQAPSCPHSTHLPSLLRSSLTDLSEISSLDDSVTYMGGNHPGFVGTSFSKSFSTGSGWFGLNKIGSRVMLKFLRFRPAGGRSIRHSSPPIVIFP
jgi:hypothetical protein